MTEIVNAAVAVLLREDGFVLLGQRPQGKSWAGWWEFPGGKIEAGETPYHALQRELHEELGIEATAATPWLNRIFSYSERTVRLHFFSVRRWSGEPHGKENQQLSWQHPAAPSVGPLLPANVPVLEALKLPTQYAITNLAEMGETAFFAALERYLQHGLRLIQVREKQLERTELVGFAKSVIGLARHYGARVVVNGDVEQAREAGTDGLHLSSAALMTCSGKPENLLCGASCHNALELAHAASLGMDYALLGAVQATRTHPTVQPLGWSKFAKLAANQPMPVYALGGMTPADLHTAWEYGAHGVAMLREVWK